MATSQSSLFIQFRNKIRDPNGKIFNDSQVLGFANDSIYQIETDGKWMWPANAATNQSITLVDGTQEYALNSDFAQLDIIVIGTNALWPEAEIDYQTAIQLSINASNSTPSSFYFRGSNIGFYPIPTAGTATIYYRKTVGLIAMSDADIPFSDDFVDAITDLMASNAYKTLVGGNYAQEVIRFDNSYLEKLNQLKLRYLAKNPKGLNFKTKRRGSYLRQRTDNVLFLR